MPVCKNCKSELVVKNGFVRGKQRFLCKACGLNFVEFLSMDWYNHSNISKLQVFPSCAEMLRNILATCWFYNIFAPKIYLLMYTLRNIIVIFTTGCEAGQTCRKRL
jgi:hypothetical protein